MATTLLLPTKSYTSYLFIYLFLVILYGFYNLGPYWEENSGSVAPNLTKSTQNHPA